MTVSVLGVGNPEMPGGNIHTSPGGRTFLVGDHLIARLIRNLEELKEEMKINRALLQSLHRTSQPEEDVTLPADFSFPITSMEQFEDMEMKLVDADIQNSLVCVLGDIGGRNIDDCIRRIMGHIMSNSMCLRFNMVGRNGKKSFGATRMFGVVYRSVKRNKLDNVSKNEVERGLSKWFLGGRDRGWQPSSQGSQGCPSKKVKPSRYLTPCFSQLNLL